MSNLNHTLTSSIDIASGHSTSVPLLQINEKVLASSSSKEGNNAGAMSDIAKPGGDVLATDRSKFDFFSAPSQDFFDAIQFALGGKSMDGFSLPASPRFDQISPRVGELMAPQRDYSTSLDILSKASHLKSYEGLSSGVAVESSSFLSSSRSLRNQTATHTNRKSERSQVGRMANDSTSSRNKSTTSSALATLDLSTSASFDLFPSLDDMNTARFLTQPVFGNSLDTVQQPFPSAKSSSSHRHNNDACKLTLFYYTFFSKYSLCIHICICASSLRPGHQEAVCVPRGLGCQGLC